VNHKIQFSIYINVVNYCDVVIVNAVCVKTATIIGVTHGSVVDADTVISCTADVNARPPASYIWTNHVDNSHSAGPQFVLQPGTQYKLTCTASNNFDRCWNVTDYVEFNSKLIFHLLYVSTVYCIVIDKLPEDLRSIFALCVVNVHLIFTFRDKEN